MFLKEHRFFFKKFYKAYKLCLSNLLVKNSKLHGLHLKLKEFWHCEIFELSKFPDSKNLKLKLSGYCLRFLRMNYFFILVIKSLSKVTLLTDLVCDSLNKIYYIMHMSKSLHHYWLLLKLQFTKELLISLYDIGIKTVI